MAPEVEPCEQATSLDLELRLGIELCVVVQQQRLADLVAVRLLRAPFHQDLALKDSLRSTFLKT